jgi:archaemetzincin
MMTGVVQLVSIGSAPRSMLRDLADALDAELGLEAVLGATLGDPKYAFNEDRSQYHSTAILRRLSSLRSKEQIGVLGLAEVDLFVPDLDFVFGESDRESRAALVSIARLKPERLGAPVDVDLLRARARSEVVHEIGHLLGLSHCEEPGCAMSPSTSAADMDRKGSVLCVSCRSELSRLARRK